MNDAQTYPIGLYQTAHSGKATAAAPTVGRVRPLDAATQRCRRSPKGQTEPRTDSHAADGFLKCTFLPKLEQPHPLPPCRETVKTERDFYFSLSRLSGHYGIQPLPTEHYSYPYNIALAMWDLQGKLKRKDDNWYSLRLVTDGSKTFLIGEQRYNTGTTLYYIPVAPLYRMLGDTKRKKAAQLLLSACSYLYNIADIPYYRQENNYMYWMYEMMNDWVEQDENTEETDVYLAEIRQAEYIGDVVEKKLFNSVNLRVFEKRLHHFKPHDPFERECRIVASDALALYRQYPNECIFRNAPNREATQADDYDDEIISMDKYISFIADTDGWLYESLSDAVNNTFNEYGNIEEPTICNRFDGSDVRESDLDFENRIFLLLDDICRLLNNYKTS